MRWLVSIPIAALVVVAIFLAMSSMIRQPVETAAPIERPEIVITAKRELPPDPPPDPPVDPEPPEPIEIERQERLDNPGDTGGVPAPEPINPVDPIGPNIGAVASPTIVVAPQYPESCRARGAEGSVIVAFDVNPDGSVTNARIVESSNSCFNRTVLRAVERWKYPPDLSTGEARVRRGVTERFVFELEDE